MQGCRRMSRQARLPSGVARKSSARHRKLSSLPSARRRRLRAAAAGHQSGSRVSDEHRCLRAGARRSDESSAVADGRGGCVVARRALRDGMDGAGGWRGDRVRGAGRDVAGPGVRLGPVVGRRGAPHDSAHARDTVATGRRGVLAHRNRGRCGVRRWRAVGAVVGVRGRGIRACVPARGM